MSSQTISFIANRYEVTQQLATTALGVLVYARDWLTERQDDAPAMVLLLAVEPSLSAIPEFDAVLNRVLEKFRQPNSALKVIDLRIEHEIYWLVLDEADGEPFNTYCHHADTTPFKKLQVCLNQILKAAKAIVPSGGFGFLEPSAIWCSGSNHFKLLNAPLAITANILSLAQQKKVSPTAALTFHSAYISPQVAQGFPATPQDDTFSIAAIAYQLLAQQPAFGALDTLQAYKEQASPLPLTQIKADTWEVLRRALSLQRHSRQPSPYELLHAFTVIPSNDTPTNKVITSSAIFKPLFAGLAAIFIIVVGAYFVLSTSNKQHHNVTPQQTTASVSVTNNIITPIAPPVNVEPRKPKTEEPESKAVQAAHSQQLEKPVIATSTPVQNEKTPVQRTNQPVNQPVVNNNRNNRSVVATPPRRNDGTTTSTAQITANNIGRAPQQEQMTRESAAAAPSQPIPTLTVSKPAIQTPLPARAAASPPAATVQPSALRPIVVQQDASTFVVVTPPLHPSSTPNSPPVRQVMQTGENTFVVQQ